MDLSNEKIKKLKSNKHYRINDLFFGWGMRWEADRKKILSDPIYEETILFDYLSKKKQELDYPLFKEIVQSKTKEFAYPTPDEDELVIQVRLGDIMDSRQYESAKKRSEIFYSKFFDYVDISPFSFSKITAVTAMHFGDNEIAGEYSYTKKAEAESLKIIECLSSQCKSKGYDLNIYSHSNIDQDICYLASSSFFVKGITPLGDLIVKCLPYNTIIFEPFSYY